jgi:hypothetical protein
MARWKIFCLDWGGEGSGTSRASARNAKHGFIRSAALTVKVSRGAFKSTLVAPKAKMELPVSGYLLRNGFL